MKNRMARKHPPPTAPSLPMYGRAVVMDKRPGTPPNMPGRSAQQRLRVRNASQTKQLLTAICQNDGQTVELLENICSNKICHPNTGASLHQLAVIHNYPAILQILLNIPNLDMDVKDNDGRTALHYAAAISGLHGDLTMYYLLTEAGAKDTTVDCEGFTPLDIRQNPDLIQIERSRQLNTYPILFDQEWDNLLATMDETTLASMIIQGELDLSSAPPPTHQSDVYARLALLQAQILGIWDAINAEDERTVKQLLHSKSLASCRDKDGRTPLHLAYKRGFQPVIDYLLHLNPEAAQITDNKGRVPAALANVRHMLHVPVYNQRRGSRTKILHQSRFQSIDTEKMRDKNDSSDYGDALDNDVMNRLLTMNMNAASYKVLEELQMEGKADQIWHVLKKNIGNEKLTQHISAFRKLQAKMNDAINAIENNEEIRFQQLIDDDIVSTRDTRGMYLLHIAVLRERHEMAEFIALHYPQTLSYLDQCGRTAAHYAAIQPNAIYDTLVDLGTDTNIEDVDGNTAEAYRQSPRRLVRPSSVSSSLMCREISTDDEFYDPDAPTEEQLDEWIELGEIKKLEQVVLDGRSHMLRDKTTLNAASKEFLKGLPQYQSKIDAIHKAVEDGDVRRVKSLIDRPPLASARDSYGMTPLHKALLHGQTNTVRYLLSKYPSCVNSIDHAGRTPLHYAAADPNGEHMIKVLQKSGGDAFIEDKHGHTPFYYRTHGQRLNVRSMKDNAVMNQLISGQLSRPLLQDLEEDIYDWIHTGNIGKLEELVLTGYADLLLGRNHEVEDADSIGFLEVLPQYQAKIQAIHKAVESGNLRAVKLLTDRKKLALCRDSRGLSPLHKAIVFDRSDIAKYLIRNYPQSVNAMDQKKRTPLHYAAALRDGGYLYKVMRKSGADPNIYDCNGRPAKYYLKHPGEIDLTALRLDVKAALKQVLHNRVAPSYLESSIQQWLRDGQVAKLEQLVLSGCGDLLQGRVSSNPDTTGFLDDLPSYMEKIDGIHRAIREGDLDKVKLLMTTKKLAISRDRFGCTPLHAAIVHEQTEIVRYVAGHFPSVLNAPDYNKRTAMHYAAAARDGGHYLKILGKAGADPMAVDNEGRTPDYYRRNAVIDLKLIKDRDDDYENVGEEIMEDGPMIESPASPDSQSDISNLDSARQYDEDDDNDRNRFERYVHARVDLPTSENGIYLARTVAPVLTKALAEVLLRRPADPIGFISEWLLKYHGDLPRANGHS